VKDVLFITLENKTGIANLVVWPQLFEQHQRAQGDDAELR
jgi:error-prone DNA polymerase